MNATLKEFLEECDSLGLVRLIVKNGGAVLEARGRVEKLFYAEISQQGQYANMHTDVFEFHLNMDRVSQVKFETGEAKRGNFTTYAIRLLSETDDAILSIFLQWGKPGEYEPGQIEAWTTLKHKYGETWVPSKLIAE